MRRRERGPAARKGAKAVVWLLLAALLAGVLPVAARAADGRAEVAGQLYTFDGESHYEFSSAETSEETDGENTCGVFSVSGSFTEAGSQGGVPAFEVTEGNLSLYYTHGDGLLNAAEESWHLVEDKSKKLDTMTLEEKIGKGAILLQTSKDRLTWVDHTVITDAFEASPSRTGALCATSEVELLNGCYYRLIVAYELARKTGERTYLFISRDEYEYRKCVEVYEFYACTDSGAAGTAAPEQRYQLGSRVKVSDGDNYTGEESIGQDDIHYGWELGEFYVSGFTERKSSGDGSMTFLKNVGDRVTLWFHLNQNINAIGGDEDLSITADTEACDQYFETDTMDFGRGTLIIRYTDYNNVTEEPVIYTNYLEANATAGADTRVQLFEEGDYEVALDYEVTRDKLMDKVEHYRIFFRFSVRNGNCMVYPFDVETGSELTNSSMTENGFRLDLAKSRYLTINIKREVLAESADGLVEDTRFNGPARDGAEYTEEGIYTITVHNQYTNQLTVKKIYVGTNDVLRAHMTTGLSIPEINELIEQGATIAEDGTIELAAALPEEEPPEETEVEEETAVPEAELETELAAAAPPEEEVGETMPVVPVAAAAGGIGVAGVLSLMFRRRSARARGGAGK